MKVLLGEMTGVGSKGSPFLLEPGGCFLEPVFRVLERRVERGEVREERPHPQLPHTFMEILAPFFLRHGTPPERLSHVEEVPDPRGASFWRGRAEP